MAHCTHRAANSRPAAFGSVGRVLLVEVALSVALLNCALVTARALASYIGDIPALPKGQVLTARLSGETSKETRDRLLAAIRTMPGVVSAGVASHLPRLDPAALPIVIEPRGGQSQPLTGSAPATAVSDGFLESIGGRRLTGRSFTASDLLTGAAPVAIVNQPFVDRFFNGRSPVGRRVNVSAEGWREIVGVVPDLGVSAGDRRRALLLSVVSIYALLSFMVTRRTREIGIRVALGARRSQVLATVAGHAFALVGAGAAFWDHRRCDARRLPIGDADPDARRRSDDACDRNRRADAGQPGRRVVGDAPRARHSALGSACQRVAFRMDVEFTGRNSTSFHTNKGAWLQSNTLHTACLQGINVPGQSI